MVVVLTSYYANLSVKLANSQILNNWMLSIQHPLKMSFIYCSYKACGTHAFNGPSWPVPYTLGTSDINYYSVSTAGTVGGKYPLLSIDGADGNWPMRARVVSWQSAKSAQLGIFMKQIFIGCAGTMTSEQSWVAASMNQLIDVNICRIS
jgi:hypothetical protein